MFEYKIPVREETGSRKQEFLHTHLVEHVGRLLARQAEEGLHPRRRRQGGEGGPRCPAVGRQRRQGGLAHVQRRRHRLADVQRLVERQPAQAVGVEVVRRQEGLGAEQRRLGRRRGRRRR